MIELPATSDVLVSAVTSSIPFPSSLPRPVPPASLQPAPFLLHFHVPAIAPSTNEFYGKLTTKERIKIKIRWQHMIAREVRKQRLMRWRGKYPVIVECYGCFAKGARMYDADNLAVTMKMIIDGLVTVKILAGDSPPFVRRAVMEPVRVGEGKSRTVLVVREG